MTADQFKQLKPGDIVRANGNSMGFKKNLLYEVKNIKNDIVYIKKDSIGGLTNGWPYINFDITKCREFNEQLNAVINEI